MRLPMIPRRPSLTSTGGGALVAALVATFIGGVVALAFNLIINRYQAGLRHVELLEEREELFEAMKAQIDCDKTVATSRATCDANSSVHVATYKDSCGVLTAASTDGSLASATVNDVRATCGRDGSGYFISLEYRRWADASRTTLMRDTLTGKTLDWGTLGSPLRCQSASDYVIGYPYYFPGFYNLVFTDSSINFAGKDPRVAAKTNTLTLLCQLLGFPGFRGAEPPGYSDSSPSNNLSLFALSDASGGAPVYQDSLMRVYSSAVYNSKIGPRAMVCASPAAASLTCP